MRWNEKQSSTSCSILEDNVLYDVFYRVVFVGDLYNVSGQVNFN